MTTPSAPADGPPAGLVAGLVDGPSGIVALEWHDEVGSTNALAVEAARAGAPELTVVGADVQTAGRGRRGRAWHAPAGTSLQVSVVLRPDVDEDALPLVVLLAGVVVAEVASAHVPHVPVSLKWPNDVLVGGRKAAGILSERVPGAVILGIGLNTDWRGVKRPAELGDATSLAEAAGGPVDRWRVLAGLLGVLDRRYAQWREAPLEVLRPYRERSATIGRDVRAIAGDGSVIEGRATDVGPDGALEVVAGGVSHRLHAGDVTHIRAP